MDYVILDSRKRDFQIWISLFQITTFEKPAPDYKTPYPISKPG